MISNKVSVIMNCYNGEKFLKKAVQSVINQTYVDWELIFWDNKSTDRSRVILNSFHDERIKYIYSNDFKLLYDARNEAIQKSNGDYITFLDVDDWWEKDKLSIQLNEFETNKDISVVYTNYLLHRNGKTHIMYEKLPSGKIFDNLIHENFIGVSTLMIKRSVFFNDNNYFNKSYHIIGDYEYCLRLSLDYHFKYIENPLLNYRIHGENESLKKEKLKIQELKILLSKLRERFHKSFFALENKIIYFEGCYAINNKIYKKLISSFMKVSFKFKIILLVKFLKNVFK
jgi:glycosyltransferase involved in cell wall biosynthesis